jgi:hypothetical protein
MKYSYNNYVEGECSASEFISQFSNPQLKVGGEYIQYRGGWNEQHFLIIYLDGEIAVGRCIWSKITNKATNEYSLFRAKDGFQYKEMHPSYRLVDKPDLKG